MPQARKKSPVARHNDTLTSLPALIRAAERTAAALLAAAAASPGSSSGSFGPGYPPARRSCTAARASNGRKVNLRCPPSVGEYSRASGSASRSGMSRPAASSEPASPTRTPSSSSTVSPVPSSARSRSRTSRASRSPRAATSGIGRVRGGGATRSRHGTSTPPTRHHSFGPNDSAASWPAVAPSCRNASRASDRSGAAMFARPRSSSPSMSPAVISAAKRPRVPTADRIQGAGLRQRAASTAPTAATDGSAMSASSLRPASAASTTPAGAVVTATPPPPAPR